MTTMSREYTREYARRWRAKNPEKVAVQYARSAAHRDLLRAAADGERARGCVDCGEKDLRVLDFDHVRGVKIDHIGRMVSGYCSVSTLYAEIDKCEVRCANCHRRITSERKAK